MEDELKSLIGKLENDNVEPDPLDELEEIPQEVDPLDDVESIDSDGKALEPIDVREVSEIVDEDEDEEVDSRLDVIIDEYSDMFKKVTTEVLENCRSDRAEVFATIERINGFIDKYDSSVNAPPKQLIDGIVKALEVKSNINQNATRILEANAKYLSAIKSSIKITNNTASFGSGELNNLLDS